MGDGGIARPRCKTAPGAGCAWTVGIPPSEDGRKPAFGRVGIRADERVERERYKLAVTLCKGKYIPEQAKR